MDYKAILNEVSSWPIEDRLSLIEQVWQTLDIELAAVRLSESQMQDLQHRINNLRDNPRVGTPWHEVKARLLAVQR